MRKHLRVSGIVALAATAAVGAVSGPGGARAAHGFARTARARPSVQGVEVASVDRGVLTVTDEATGAATVLGRGPYRGALGSAIQDPGFSPDGRFVAYIEDLGNGTDLHVVPVHGSGGAIVAGAQSYAWSPARDELAVSRAHEVELISAGGTPARRWPMTDPGTPLFSPTGARLAIGSPGGRSGRGHLWLLSTRGGPPRSVRQPGCELPAAWSADGTRLLFWRDGNCSASIAADGLALDSVTARDLPTNGGRRPALVDLGRTLPYRGWVVPVSGTTVIVNSGGNRVAADHKSLHRCNAATGACSALAVPAGFTTLDPAVADRTHRLFAIRVPQSDAMNDFLPRGTLWSSALTGGHADELMAAGTGVADPVPVAGGSRLILVRMRSARSAVVETVSLRSGEVRTVAAVDPADYYGEFMASLVLAVWQPHSPGARTG